MSGDDDKQTKFIPKISFIVRKDDESVSPEDQERLRKRLEELFNIYAYGRMNEDISGLERKPQVRRRKKVVVEPYKAVPCDASNRPPFEE